MAKQRSGTGLSGRGKVTGTSQNRTGKRRPGFDLPVRSLGLRRLKLRISIAFAGLAQVVAGQCAVERDAGGGFLWSAVWLGVGCLIYFCLPREPMVLAFPIVVAVAGLLAMKFGRGYGGWNPLLILVLLAAGASLAQVRTSLVSTQTMPRPVIADVRGVVVAAERRANGSIRYTITLSGEGAYFRTRSGRSRPRRVRATARSGSTVFQPGETIAGKVRVGPLSGPAYPGAYDFGFQTWFSGISGSGFFLGTPQRSNGNHVIVLSAGLWLNRIRNKVATIVRSSLPDGAGALAIALIVGDRSGIDEETAEALRRSGLAHILAISGLHMALVASTVLYSTRWLLALNSVLVLHYPVRKWAAATALLATTFYLGLSGANVSAQRAYVMVSIMLIAVLFDRRALTMRNVVIAALVVLTITPEAIFAPGFQMSFAAVAALIATYEVLSQRAHQRPGRQANGRLVAVYRFGVRNLGGLAMTSLIAGLSTGLFAAYHFQRVAPFGLLANLLAMPLVTLFVMPLALMSVLFMPFGLERLFLEWMSFAIAGVVAVARWVADLKPHGNIGHVPVESLVFGATALLMATLFRSRLKVVGLPMAGVALLFFGTQSGPQIVILENGRQVGLIHEPGALSLLRPNAEKFNTEIWMRAFAPGQLDRRGSMSGSNTTGPVFSCDRLGCAATIGDIRISHIKSVLALEDDCRLANIIVAPFPLPQACLAMSAEVRPLIIDSDVLRGSGSLAIRIAQTGKACPFKVHSAVRDRDRYLAACSAKMRLLVTKSYPDHTRPWTAHRATGFKP